MRRKNQTNIDAHKPTRRPRRDTVLEEQLRQYAEACKVAKANNAPRPHISDYVK